MLEFKAGCRLYVSIPGPNIDKRCPGIDLDYSRDIDPVIGAERSTIGDWWLNGSVTGLKVGIPIASASLDIGIGAEVTNGRIGVRAWRAVHWAAYACWPVAFLHGLGTGSDVRPGWMTYLALACAALVVAAITARLADRRTTARVRVGAVAALVTSAVAVAVWLPNGPLAKGWAAKAGTPSSLIGGHQTTTRTTP